MRTFVLRRVAQAVVTVVLVMTVTFVLIRLAPGDPLAAVLDNPMISEEVRARQRAAFGLDRPILEQYWRYVTSAARGDFGFSVSRGTSVAQALAEAVPNTLVLMLVALAASFALGILIGIIQAIRQGTAADHTLGAGALFFYSMPDFWLALMVLLLFSYRLGVLPAGGMYDPIVHDMLGFWQRLVERARHLILPAGTLTLLSAAAIARYQRSAVLDVARQDFVRTARAKGLRERRVVFRHILRNALLPVITLFGLAFPALLGGAVFVERVFAWPGMGSLAVQAIAARDYWLVTATVVVGGTMVAIGNLVADVLYAVADPRLREAG